MVAVATVRTGPSSGLAPSSTSAAVVAAERGSCPQAKGLEVLAVVATEVPKPSRTTDHRLGVTALVAVVEAVTVAAALATEPRPMGAQVAQAGLA